MAGPPDPIPTNPVTQQQGNNPFAGTAAEGLYGGGSSSGGSLGGDAIGSSSSTTTGGNLGQLAAGGLAPMQGTGVDPAYNAATAGVQGNQTAGFQYGMSDSGAVDQSKIDPAQMPNMSVQGHQPYNQEMLNAYYGEAQKRLDPQWDQRQHDLETQAQNMGLTRGSEAWNREMQNMSGQRNDAYGSAMNQAILNSGAEGQRAQNMDIAAGNFGNQATQQNFQNQLTSQTQQNTQQQQRYNQNLGAANLNNAGLTAQQNAAQGWKGLDVQSEGNRLGAEASRYGADKSYAGQMAAAGATTAVGQMQAALRQREIQNAERGQDFDMYWNAKNNAVDYQNKVAAGMNPGSPTFGTNPAVAGEAGYAGGMNTGQGQINSGISNAAGNVGNINWGSLGGSAVGQSPGSYYQSGR